MSYVIIVWIMISPYEPGKYEFVFTTAEHCLTYQLSISKPIKVRFPKNIYRDGSNEPFLAFQECEPRL